jgi:hypothetical protein
MIHIKTNDRVPIAARYQHSYAATRDQIAYGLHTQAANILRVLILVLVGLLFILVGLTLLTGHVEIGGPIVIGIVLSGLVAAQFGR